MSVVLGIILVILGFLAMGAPLASGMVVMLMIGIFAIAGAQSVFNAYRDLLSSTRFQRAANAGARSQRLLFASTGTKDPKVSDTLYVKALAAPFTVNTMPEGTLKAFHDHGEIGETIAANGGACEAVLGSFAEAGVDTGALAARLQDEGAASFVESWNELMACVDSKHAAVRGAS